MRRTLVLCLALLISLSGVLGVTPAAAEGPNAILALPSATSADGCRDIALPRNDDGSGLSVALPFALNFFGRSYSTLYVNNNGNVTFDFPMSTYTPFPIITTGRPLIAPFFADVDTRNVSSDLVRYTAGFTTYGGQRAFCINWVNVGYYNARADKLNSFQLVLVERPDTGAGDFDILMNFDKILWETGDASGGSGGLGGSPARMGYSNGTSAAFEQPGSGVRGAFLNSNLTTGLIHNSRGTTQLGRYIFPVRNGVAPVGATVAGQVFGGTTANPLVGAFVQMCSGGMCSLAQTAANGRYTFTGVQSGPHTISANPPTAGFLSGALPGPVTVTPQNASSAATVTAPDLILDGPTPPPAGTTIGPVRGYTSAGVPIVYWGDTLTLATQGCAGGSATYEVRDGGIVIASGPMSESPAGTYTGTIAPLRPNSGFAEIAISIVCGSLVESIAFDVYIDPSGHVRTTTGDPIAGATVTLYRSDSPAGPFSVVPSGSAIMSPANRDNPDSTDAFGRFGWDVLVGYYIVRATAEGCVSPSDPARTFVETPVLPVPPPWLDLDLRLSCPSQNRAPVATAGGPYDVAEGSSVALAGSGNDPDAGQTLTYAWDLDNDGTFETAGLAASFSAAAVDGPATRTVVLKVCDSATPSLCDTDAASVTISNVAPTATASNDGPRYWGIAIGFTGTATDPSPADAAAGFTGAWTFGDSATASGMTASHAYATPGIYTASFAATDKDGGVSAPATTTVTVDKRPTTLSCADASAVFGFAITLTSELRDGVSNAVLTGETIAWTVNGAPLAGSTTPSGLMPGAHTVGATFAGNALYTGSTATCTLTVTNAVGKITSGLIRFEGKGRGGFNVQHDAVEGTKGELQFQTSSVDLHVHTMTAIGISADKRKGWFAGTGTNGQKVVVYVEDNGEPGRNDIFRIWVNGTAQNGDGAITGGNVQIH
ncbi:MAG TPA: nidogen-like domain-containing protein [Candidatus Limnocylindria bacterium]|nr:nidogen-like domain-containing protein [Candidatus Limnocylindria bacterium]